MLWTFKNAAENSEKFTYPQLCFDKYILYCCSKRRYRSRSILALLDNGIFLGSTHDCSYEIHPREIRNFAAQKRERARGRKNEKRQARWLVNARSLHGPRTKSQNKNPIEEGANGRGEQPCRRRKADGVRWPSTSGHIPQLWLLLPGISFVASPPFPPYVTASYSQETEKIARET